MKRSIADPNETKNERASGGWREMIYDPDKNVCFLSKESPRIWAQAMIGMQSCQSLTYKHNIYGSFQNAKSFPDKLWIQLDYILEIILDVLVVSDHQQS